MWNKLDTRKLLQEAIIFFLLTILFSFMCRLWFITFFAVIGLLTAGIWRLVLIFKKAPSVEPISKPTENPITETHDDWYSVILRKISELVQNEYPNAKWVWQKPNAMKRIQNGEELSIILNSAGGYRRAMVVMEDFKVVGLEYCEQANETDSDEVDEETDTSDSTPHRKEKKGENFDLLAYEWVQENIMSLNERCNEAVGQGLQEIFLAAEELPVKESWRNICAELIREEIKDVECMPDGIKIKLNKRND